MKKALKKFKSDAPSKVIYDLIKYVFISIFAVAGLTIFPALREWILSVFTISILSFIIVVALSLLAGATLCYFIFRNKTHQLEQESLTDELTGVKNYKALSVDLDDILNTQKSNKLTITLILIDVDDFKLFNNTNSYEVADKVLAKLGQTLQRDGRITDEIYRYFNRGDEFLIVAKETNLASGKKAAERKRKLIQNTPFFVEQQQFNLTVCCGITELTDKDTKETALERLQTALKNAKNHPNKNKSESIA